MKNMLWAAGVAGILSLGATAASAVTVSCGDAGTSPVTCDVTADKASTIKGSVSGGLTDLTLSWAGASPVSASSLTSVFAAGETKAFVVNWTGSGSAVTSFSVVPLPAGALLLGTGLAALGFARRRKRA